MLAVRAALRVLRHLWKHCLAAVFAFVLCYGFELETVGAFFLTAFSMFLFPVIDHYPKARREIEDEEKARREKATAADISRQLRSLPTRHHQKSDQPSTPKWTGAPPPASDEARASTSARLTGAAGRHWTLPRVHRGLLWGLLAFGMTFLAFFLYLVLYHFPYIF